VDVDVTTAEIRKLIDRPVGPNPVTSIYLNTDGARFPRAADYEARLDGLLREARKTGERQGGDVARSVEADVEAISRWVRREFDRGDVRGLALFASGGEVFETVEVALGVRNIARVDERPYVVPLEVLLGRQHRIGLVRIERDKARIFRYQLGRIEETYAIASDVHGQHMKGGWSQLRYQHTIEHELLHHMKDVGEVLRKLHDEEPFDCLVIAGPHTEALELSKHLHPYLQERLHGEPISMPNDLTVEGLKAKFAEVEQQLVSERRSELLQRLAAAQGVAEKAARGIRHVLEAVNQKKVETLFVVEGAGSPGYRSATGALALREDEAQAYGGPVEPVDDLIDECIEESLRGGATIEFFRDEVRLDGHPAAALLRF
jgi:peptide chain release factor subunit 1